MNLKISSKTIFITLILSFLVFVESLYAKKNEAILSSATEVSPKSEITLYDLIEVKHMDEDALESLKKIVVADRNTTELSKIELIKKIKNLNIQFTLPDEIKLLRSQSQVSRMEVSRKVMNQLKLKCSECDYQIQVNSVPLQMSSDWELDLNIDLNKTNLLIPIYSKNSQTNVNSNRQWVILDVKKIQSVPVLSRALKANESIKRTDLKIEKRTLTSYQEILTDIDSIIGMQTQKFLPMGSVLTSQDLKREIVLKKGQMVKAIVGLDQLEISIMAQAEESGAVGDVIKVKNIDSQKMFAAKIVEKGIVKIE